MYTSRINQRRKTRTTIEVLKKKKKKNEGNYIIR